MSAVAQEKPPPTRTKGTAEVAAFVKKYDEALEDAQVSKLHTATEGWQQLYQSRLASFEKRRKALGSILHSAATSVERGESGKILEDCIGDCKKDFVALCGEIAIFDRQTVDPVKEAMHHCHEVIAQARREAAALESNSPLISKGVLDAIEKAIKKVEKVTFDSQSGRIEIEFEPPSDDDA